jgi:S-formylglutathione hydrolase FrmB
MALVQVNFYADTLQRTVPFNAVIPTDKTLFSVHEKPVEKKPFKTLYLLHGGLGNYSDWLGGTRIQVWAQDKDLAVIMPSGDNRFYIDDPELDASYGNYGQFIGEELIQFTRDTFPLSHKREDTFIAGLSMGGYGAVVNGLRWHKTFSRIGALSAGFVLGEILDGYDKGEQENMGRVFPGDFRRGLERTFGGVENLRGSNKDYKGLIKQLKAEGADIPKIYMACGENDFILHKSRDYHQFLLDEGIEHTYEEGSGGHDWTFWDTYIKKFLDWLPLDKTAVAGKHSGNVHEAKVNSPADIK